MSQFPADKIALVVRALNAIGQRGISQTIVAGRQDASVLRPAYSALLNEKDLRLQKTARDYFGRMAANMVQGQYRQSRIEEMCEALEAVGRPDLSRQMTTTPSRDLLRTACSALLSDQACSDQLAARDFLRKIPGVAL